MKLSEAFTYTGYDVFNLVMNVFFAFLIVSFSIMIPDRVADEDELKSVRFGLPKAFVVQDLSDRVDYGSLRSFPAWVTPGVPMEYPTDWNLILYVLDIFLVWWFFFLCYKRLVSYKRE